MPGIYIHIPYCKQACHYCDFHFSTSMKTKSGMIEAICTEVKIRSEIFNNQKINTVYFGGGTPSVLAGNEINLIMKKIHKHFDVSQDAEITIETNPEDVSKDYIRTLKNNHINRVSIGIQTFNDASLKFINRNHTAQKAIDSIKLLQDSGFDNISGDLIYSLPGNEKDILVNDLEQFRVLELPHISIYSFTLEKDTVFGRWYEKGKLKIANEDSEAAQYQMINETLKSLDYSHYEVSNYCIPGYESRHNSSYWKGIPYLGLGPGAHSFDGKTRWSNIRNNPKYIKFVKEGKEFSDFEPYNVNDRVNDLILTGLRTHWGVDFPYIMNKYSIDIQKIKSDEISKIVNLKLGTLIENNLKLNEKGLFYADKIAGDLMI